jgi:hypothetical protein
MSANPTTEAEVLTYMARLAVIEPDLVNDDEAHELAGRICRTLRQAFALTWGRNARRAFAAITTETVWEYDPTNTCPECSAGEPFQDEQNAALHVLLCHAPECGWMIDEATQGPEMLARFLERWGHELPADVVAILTELLNTHQAALSARLELHAHRLHTLEAEPEVLNAEHAHEHARRRPERCHHRPHLVAMSTNDDPASAGHFGAKNRRYLFREADRRR